MTEASRLSAHERDLLAEIVESSFRVVERHHFFAWGQGIVQSLMPHEILICGVDDGARQGMSMHHFSGTRYFKEEHFAAVCAPRDGLVPRLMSEWQATGRPCIVGNGANGNGVHGALLELVEKNELRNLAAHGVRGGARGVAGFYAFSRISGDLGAHTAYIAEVLVPYVHATFVRVLADEVRPGNGPSRAQRPITGREAEILRWIKEGKTNLDIASILELSPWTVKNHVQTILKKLSAQTRGQAVARAISLGLLDSGE